MIILDENSVEQAHAMILAAAAPHGVLFEPPPAGGGFASVEDLTVQAGNGLNIFLGLRSHAAQTLEEIQRGPFAGQDAPNVSSDDCQSSVRLDAAAVFRKRF